VQIKKTVQKKSFRLILDFPKRTQFFGVGPSNQFVRSTTNPGWVTITATHTRTSEFILFLKVIGLEGIATHGKLGVSQIA
jgi:hypothetical protein